MWELPVWDKPPPSSLGAQHLPSLVPTTPAPCTSCFSSPGGTGPALAEGVGRVAWHRTSALCPRARPPARGQAGTLTSRVTFPLLSKSYRVKVHSCRLSSSTDTSHCSSWTDRQHTVRCHPAAGTPGARPQGCPSPQLQSNDQDATGQGERPGREGVWPEERCPQGARRALGPHRLREHRGRV